MGIERRKTLTMNWDGLDDEVDMLFFETYNRLSTAVPDDLASSSDEDEDYEDSRISFSSAVSAFHPAKHRKPEQLPPAASITPNYDIWMAAPGSITERRRRLLGSMGLVDNKEDLKKTSDAIGRAITKKFDNNNNNNFNYNYSYNNSNQEKTPTHVPSISIKSTRKLSSSSSTVSATSSGGSIQQNREHHQSPVNVHQSPVQYVLVRSRSEGVPCTRARHVDGNRIIARDANETSMRQLPPMSPMVTPGSGGVGAFFLIKNLDTGKEFIVKEYGENGTWNRLSDLETGKQLTMEEFENTVGHSRFIKDLMRRANYGRHDGVASGIVGERESSVATPQAVEQPKKKEPEGKNKWVKVRQTGKSQKDLSALHLCQEFQAHEGCIWAIRFSLDGRFLASAGEDKVIHVWEVQECEVMSMKPEEGHLTPIHPSLMSSMERGVEPNLGKKKGKFGSKRGGSAAIPEYVHVPENVFTFSEKPYCSFHGHLDEVLDLSWSRSQLLLSSSMDKTVRLWDLDTKTCLKFFAHNDYVTCIQFNPMDDDYFISGSLDAKVRMWNIPNRLVVDWTDIHDLVTAVSYTPDGQGVLVGTQKGSCRTYGIEDYKLSQTNTVELRNKKKNLLKKVTGFQFSPSNPSEVLITSGDSRIRIVEGFRNPNSQMAASFTPNGRFIISPSEDSQVYVWKNEEHKSSSTGKARTLLITQAHEQFPCKDVSVAIPWPHMIKGDPPQVPISNGKKQAKKALPPLPKKGNNNITESASNSLEHDPSALSRSESGRGDSLSNSKRMLPPLPKKDKDGEIEEDGEAISRTHSGIGDSFSSDPASIRYGGDSPSISAAGNPAGDSMSSNYSSYNGSHGSSAIHPSAWGLVIVTAGFGGEIRCYQNFGLPRRMGSFM
ncbi:hypothetical protein TSUD_176870 [Trifolium subterraneum]|uniref:Anaphase-promoting complex subunit 4 WD40 domain-containing protein n=1 Tax=Trifolium subterraneum TaxID=3900 RepID=A0A2Z6LRT3_TRISU|nr:hypothetical protein TSUD_176870 [Trifolium subterraneum]